MKGASWGIRFVGAVAFLAFEACSSGSSDPADASSRPPDAKCMNHADGSAVTRQGATSVTSNVGFGSMGLEGLAVRDEDVYVSARSLVPKFGGLAYNEPSAGYTIIAKVKDKAEWLWLLEGQSVSIIGLAAWKGGVVALLTGANMKITGHDGTPGPAIDPYATAGLFFSDRAKGGKTSFIALPRPAPDAVASGGLMSVSAGGAVFVVGKFPAGAKLGGRELDCGGPAIVAYDAASQKPLWARCVGATPTSAITVESLTSDGNGEATLTGFPGSNPDFGLGAKPVDASGGGSYVLHLDASGNSAWVDYTLRSYAEAQATDDGTLFFIGDAPQPDATNGLIDYFGATYLPCATDGFHTIVSRRNPDGKIAWARLIGAQVRMRVLPDKRVGLYSDLPATLADGTDVGAEAPALMILDQDGKPSVLRTLGDGVTKKTQGLSASGFGTSTSGIWLAGSFDGTLALKDTMTSTGISDVLINISP